MSEIVNLYTVTDTVTGEVIIKDEDSMIIAEILGEDQRSITGAPARGYLVAGRYRIEITGERLYPFTASFCRKFAKEWREMQKLFRNVSRET